MVWLDVDKPNMIYILQGDTMNLKEYNKLYNKGLISNLTDKASIIRYMNELDLIKTNSIFKYDGLPDTIPKEELEKIIQIHGYGIITEVKDNLYCLWGGEAPPLDAYYEATQIIVTNPWLKVNETFTYDKDCVLVKNDPFKMGLLPIINRYNMYICETDITMLLADVNMRALNIITANNDKEKKSGEEFIKQLFEGKLSVLLNEELKMNDKAMLNTLPYSNMSNGYITQIIELEQYLRGTKLNELGLQSNYNMKRERLTSSETDLNEDSLKPLIDIMLFERKQAMEKVNKMYGTNIKVDLDSSWKEQREEPKEEPKEEEEIKDDEATE